jgi:hypothetical protein
MFGRRGDRLLPGPAKDIEGKAAAAAIGGLWMR